MFVSKGWSAGLTQPNLRLPYVWWQHPRDVACPSGVWTPMPWNSPTSDLFGLSPNLHTLTTTIAAGSNGFALPKANIDVASTAGFPTAGYLVITGPPASGVDTVVKYTGKNATQFTGAGSANSPFSTGTLATGQIVTAANVDFDLSPFGYLWAAIFDQAFERTATTAYWAQRFIQVDGLPFPVAQATHGGLDVDPVAITASPFQHGQVAMQPGSASGAVTRLEALQNSGFVKLSKLDGLQGPSLMMSFLSVG